MFISYLDQDWLQIQLTIAFFIMMESAVAHFHVCREEDENIYIPLT